MEFLASAPECDRAACRSGIQIAFQMKQKIPFRAAVAASKWDFLLHLGFEIAAGVGDGLAVGCLRASGAVQGWRTTVENLPSLPDAFVDN